MESKASEPTDDYMMPRNSEEYERLRGQAGISGSLDQLGVIFQAVYRSMLPMALQMALLRKSRARRFSTKSARRLTAKAIMPVWHRC
jgi:hypothetical protein